MSKAVDNVFISLAVKSAAATRRETIADVEYCVVPAIAMKSGVLNNTLYTADEIKNFVTAWNGVPVPVGHPTENGIPVSANSPKWENKVNIGKVFNAQYERGKLKCELWLDVNKADKLGFGEVIEQFESKAEVMEISTGLYARVEAKSGVFNNQKYNAVATDIRSDHIALLPNEEGACSVEDGCGALRTNENEVKANCGCDDKSASKGVLDYIRNMFGFGVNATSDNDLRATLQSLMRENVVNAKHSWVMDVYQDEMYFVYESDNGVLYRQSFTETEGGVYALGKEPAIPVIRQTNYTPITNADDKGETTMSDKSDVVAALIANDATLFTEDDTDSLMAMSDEMLAKLSPAETEDKAKSDEPVVNNADANTDADKGITLAGDDLALFNRLKTEDATRQAEARELVVKHYSLEKDVVAKMPVDVVSAMAAKVQPNADYTGQAGGKASEVENNNYAPPSVVLGNAENKTPAEAA